MKYEFTWPAFTVFAFFVGIVLALSFYLGRKAKSAKGYYAAHGQIPWFVNGIAFAGDYLSAASFLGICGVIAFYGHDGFLYSIGYLAGWVVALFVVAEPLKRMGKFTFADALDSKFNSRGIKLTAAISTLVVSIFYLIPQMVGAGVLVKPLLGFPHIAGVLIVGVIVIFIVVTAGMVSTTWVQFIKGSMLVLFCAILVGMILNRGLLKETQVQPNQVVVKKDGNVTVDGKPQGHGPGEADVHPVGSVVSLPDPKATSTGPLGPLEFIAAVQNSTIRTWSAKPVKQPDGSEVTAIKSAETKGADLMVRGNYFEKALSPQYPRLDFVSLMLALFCGTASLPHILIRYYTVKDGAAARKSTVVGIGAIGFFYVLTLFLGLGAMTSGAMDPTNNNMSAPLLAKSFGELPFAIISAIAFTTVLGTVSGLIIAASGAVVHDLMTNFGGMKLDDHGKVRAGKIAAVFVGIIAMFLGVAFEKLNVTFLVGWAFNVAASANLPALIMVLFWKRTTKQGITVSILVGLISSLAMLLASGPAFEKVYGLKATDAWVPFTQPGIITIPLAFLVLVVVSLMTQPKKLESSTPAVAASV